MIFIETPIFTADLSSHLGDHEYGELQQYLAEHPDSGALIEGTGGLRKIRWAAQGKGKKWWRTSYLLPRDLCLSDTFAADLPERYSRHPLG